MFTLYILRDKLTKRHYIGSTNNIKRRLDEHNRHKNKSTKYGIWGIIYKEEFNMELEAKNREKLIKSYKGGNAFKKLVSGISSPVE